MKPMLFILSLVSLGLMAQTDERTPSLSKRVEIDRCNQTVATVMIIDDQVNTTPAVNDQYRELKLPTPAQIARRVATESGCFETLDPDPLLLALPGAILPDVILRVRPIKLQFTERNLIEKTDAAVRRYFSSYLGGSEHELSALKSIEIGIVLLCPKQRRVLREYVGVDADAALGSSATETTSLDTVNHQRVIAAYAQAQNEISKFFQHTPNPCDEKKKEDL